MPNDTTSEASPAEDDIRTSLSFDSELTAGGPCSNGEDFEREYPPLVGVYTEAHGRRWDFNNVGRPPSISGKQ